MDSQVAFGYGSIVLGCATIFPKQPNRPRLGTRRLRAVD